MEDPMLYVTDLPQNRQGALGAPRAVTNRLVYLIIPALVVVLVGASLYWLQWASHYGITMGYPTPTVHIISASSSPRLIHSNVQFAVTSTGRDLTYSWNFGDGTSGNGSSVSHAYESNGTFTVTVTATDPTHQMTTDTTSVTIMPPRPTASFTYAPSYYRGYISFSASASAGDPSTSIVNYTWDFGDGSNDTNGSAQEYHQYYNSGTYQVSLVVTDGTGQTSDVYTASVVI